MSSTNNFYAPETDQMHNNTMDDSTACDVSCGSYGCATSYSIIRDAKLVLVSFVAACIAIFAYNYWLQLKAQSTTEEEKDLAKTRSLLRTPAPADQNQKGISAGGSFCQNGLCASGDFLSALLSQIWGYTNIAVSNSIKEMLTPILKDLKLPIHVVKLDLGDVPIKTDNMFVRRIKSKHDHSHERIQIDFDLLWDGTCDILLQATLSSSVKLTFGVQHIKLKGRFSLLLGPLVTDLPVVSAVQYGFTNPPEISISYAGVAKNLFDSAAIDAALKNVNDSTLKGMLVLPYRMGMPVDLGTYDFLETYVPPEGMLRIGVKSGRGFKLLKKMIIDDIPDIYCLVSLGGSKPFRNKTKYDKLNPTWEDETQDFILYDWDQKIYVSVMDEDKGPMDPDDLLGTCQITARELFERDGEAELPLTMDGVATSAFVTLGAELFHLTKKSMSLSLPEFDGKNKLCGLLTVIITKAFDIPYPKEDCATSIKVVCGRGYSYEETFWTGMVADYPGIDACNPMFDTAFHVPMTSDSFNSNMEAAASCMSSPQDPSGNHQKSPRKSHRSSMRNSFIGMISRKTDASLIEMTLIDNDGPNGKKGHGELGCIAISEQDLMEAPNHTITETRSIGTDGARLEFKVFLSGIQTEEETDLSDMDIPNENNLDGSNERESESVSILLTALRGRGFQVQKRGFGKKDDVPDVYLSIPQLKWKTAVIKDDTMPQWSESKLFTTTNTEKKIRVDAFDQNKKGDDNYIGTAKFCIDQLLRKRTMEIELMNGSELTKSFVTMQCVAKTMTESNALNENDSQPLLSASAPASFSPFDKELNDEEQSVVTNLTMSSNVSSRRRRASLPNPKSLAKSMSKSFRRKKSNRTSLTGSIIEENGFAGSPTS